MFVSGPSVCVCVTACKYTYCVFYRVVHDDVIFPYWQPGAKRDDVAVPKRFRTSPCSQTRQIQWTQPYTSQRALPVFPPLPSTNDISDKWMQMSARLHVSVQHTWVVTNIRIDRKFPDVEGLNDVCVPFSSVFSVVENVVHGLSRHVFTHHPTLRDRQRQAAYETHTLD